MSHTLPPIHGPCNMDTWSKYKNNFQHHAQMVYTRAIAVDDAAEEAEAAAAAEAAKASKKGKKK